MYLSHGRSALPGTYVQVIEVHIVSGNMTWIFGELGSPTTAGYINAAVVRVNTASMSTQSVGKLRNKRPLIGGEVIVLGTSEILSVGLATDHHE